MRRAPMQGRKPAPNAQGLSPRYARKVKLRKEAQSILSGGSTRRIPASLAFAQSDCYNGAAAIIAAAPRSAYLTVIMKLRAKSPPLIHARSSMAVDHAMLEPMPSCAASRCSVVSGWRLSSCSWRAA